MLEVWDAADPFAEVADFLDERDFFAGPADGALAEVFLAYGISGRLRRTAGPAPPEPCAVPLAACRIREPGEARPAPGAFSLGAWSPT